MKASMAMYLTSQNAAAYDTFWRLIQQHLTKQGINAPTALSHHTDLAFWADERLVLSQTCGMPYRLHLHNKVTLIGTPNFGIEGCPPGYYCSIIVAHIDNPDTEITAFAKATLAVNDRLSQSGYAAPQILAKHHGFQFDNILLSGAHLASLAMVANKQADIAAIDAITWRQAQPIHQEVKQLKVIGHTKPTPGLPYICAPAINHKAVRLAVDSALAALPPTTRRALGIIDMVNIPKADYLNMENP